MSLAAVVLSQVRLVGIIRLGANFAFETFDLMLCTLVAGQAFLIILGADLPP